MSNDKTLADAQPGGMVRLGDRLVLAKLVGAAGLMLAEIDTCGHEVDPAYRRNLYEAWEEGKAALSAQPSPGETLPPGMRLGSPDYLDYLDTEPSPGGQDALAALEAAVPYLETLHSIVGGEARASVWRCIERGRAALSAQPSPGGQGDALRVIAERLRGAGANLPAPPITGTIEGSMVTGLSIALALVEDAIAAKGGER